MPRPVIARVGQRPVDRRTGGSTHGLIFGTGVIADFNLTAIPN